MGGALFIAWQDLRHQLRQGETLLWAFLMPPVFFYFIGTVTGGMSAGSAGERATSVAVIAAEAGFLRAQVDRRLRDNEFDPAWFADADAALDAQGNAPRRSLTFAAGMTRRVAAGEQVAVAYDTAAQALGRDYEILRIQRALYTTVADIAVAGARSGALTAAALEALNATPRFASLEVVPAGKRREIPSGFDQAIPGILVMFTLLVLLTSGSALLANERARGLLRRLASAPLSRAEVVGGKWGARMGLAAVQVAAALAVGTWVFGMHWGPDVAMVLLVLASWAAFCASAGLLLGCLARTEGQATGLGVLFGNALAALGGCWWPIEVTPGWMQALARILPTGWTMEALHRLVSFEAGAASALPQVAAILAGALVLGAIAAQQFRYE